MKKFEGIEPDDNLGTLKKTLSSVIKIIRWHWHCKELPEQLVIADYRTDVEWRMVSYLLFISQR